MAKYRVAVLPGDGVGKEVIEAAMIVLKKLKLDAEYRFGDIGWEFWCKEGNPLPDRTLQLLQTTDVCLFGAITSKPKGEAAKELAPELQNKELAYISPIITLRQTFHLHTNMRPCRAYPGNPMNLQDDIDLVVFRENTEGLYVGIEYHPYWWVGSVLPAPVTSAIITPYLNPPTDPHRNMPVNTRSIRSPCCSRQN